MKRRLDPPRIVFTGGGTAGHVTPNLALIEIVQKEGWIVNYIGSRKSIEQGMIAAINIPFYGINSGKLRRYFSWKNFIDPFKILLGIGQAYYLLRKLQIDLVFSKGGFVAFPVVFAAFLNKIPVIAHESDMTPGLANRLSFPFISKLCLAFAPTKVHFNCKKHNMIEITGTPIRQQLFNGVREIGLKLCGFSLDKPCLLIMGGSQGSSKLNQIIRESLPTLTPDYQVIHLCGKGNIDHSFTGKLGYYQFEYASDTLPDLFAASDLVISRSGANALYEILALRKPHILIPLSMKVTRGDQIQNAQFFSQQGISTVIDEDVLTTQTLTDAINTVNKNREAIIHKINVLDVRSATMTIIGIIKVLLDNKESK